MWGRRGVWIVGLLAAALGAAALGAHASSAAPTRAGAGASTLDKTYSCRVRKQHFVELYASVTLPPADNRPQPGVLDVITGARVTQQNGATVEIAQVSLQATKNSLRIDTKSCERVKHGIPLNSKGLPGPPTKVTPSLFGHDSERCGTAGRVLVRLRVQSTNHTPTHALLAIRNDNAKKRPVGFYNWSPQKVTVYTAGNCVSSG
jgi:hypothetical protein